MSSQQYHSVNPASGETISDYPLHSPGAIAEALQAAANAQRCFRESNWSDRAAVLRELARLLRAEREECSQLMALEMGKPIADGRGEMEKCAVLCEYYAQHGADFAADEIIASDATRSFVSYRPLGIVLAIMPWNFPFWQVLRAVIPAMAAGNAVLLKHAPNVGGCALALERLVRTALASAAPAAARQPALFANLFIDHESAGELIDHQLIRAVSFTGSTRAGRVIGARAGAALKPAVLELGGSDPAIVLADADIQGAAAVCVRSRLINGGQSCIAAKRFIVVESAYDEFLDAMLAGMRAVVMGSPLAPDTTLGPLARLDLRENLHRQVEASIADGARLLLGGEPPLKDAAGAFYPPTVLADVTPEMTAAREELFGPVASVLRARDTEQAIEIANATQYGLGAALFTKDVTRAEALARDRIEAGCVFINDFVKSDPRLPFGGIKDSGFGRELGRAGLHAFVNMKTIARA